MAVRKVIAAVAVLVALGSGAWADGPGWWPQWRGPSGQGQVTDPKVPMEWSSTKNLLWKAKLPGAGHSTPIIWGDRIFLTCANSDGSVRQVVCLHRVTGALIWEKTAAKGVSEKTHSTSSHATASCVTDGTRVYAFFGTPGIFCYDFEGKLLWDHRFGIFTSQANWGIGASPTLYEDLVIVNCDNDGPDALAKGQDPKSAAPAHLVALNKTTGKVVWSTPRNQGRGFSTPVLIKTPAGRTDLVLNGPLGVWGYDPKTGIERWHCLRHPNEENNRFGEPLPLLGEGVMYAAAGRESGYLQAIRLDGEGDITKSGLAWEKPRKGVRDVGSGIAANGVIIYADGRASISAHDIKTGTQLYFERTKSARAARGGTGFYASPILLNGKVVCVRRDGVTFIFEPGREFKVLHENSINDPTDFSASPAVADGRLYLRSQTHLYCIAEGK